MAYDTYISFYLTSCSIYVFSKTILDIGKPRYIRFMFKPDGKSMIVEAYDKMGFYSHRITRSSKNVRWGYEMRNAAICRLLANKLSWENGKSYRIPGKTYPHQKIAVYDLTASELINDNMLE